MRLRRSYAAFSLLLFVLLATLHGQAETFTNPYRIPTPGDPTSVAAADLNGDGLLDIVYGDKSTSPQTVHILLAQHGGGYTPAPTITLPANASSVCRVFDTNKDGRPDLVCVYSFTFSASLLIFLGNGDGTFTSPTTFAFPNSGSNYFDLGISMGMDLNGDGIPDLIGVDSLNNRNFVALGDGHGSFKLAGPSTSIPFIQVPIALDVNGDGKMDLLYPDGPTVSLGNGDGTFGPLKSYSQPFDYTNVCAFADMDGDGHVDAVCGYEEVVDNVDADGATHLIILHGNADGSFNPKPIVDQTYGNHDTVYDGPGTFLYPIAVMDLNGDGILDIVSFSGDGYGVLLGQPGLSFAPPKHYDAAAIASYNSTAAAFADMNGDGLPDIIASGTNGVYISYGKKDGSFATAQAFEVNQVLNSATFADFNGDGVPDVAATGDTAIQLSLGNGDGTFAPYKPLANNGILFTGQYPSTSAAIFHGDFNGDGKQDLIAVGSAVQFTQNCYLYFGHGDGSFAAPIQASGATTSCAQSRGEFVLDVNKDGRDDLVFADTSTTVAGQTPNIYVSLSNGDGSFRTITTPVPVEMGANSGAFNAILGIPALADFNHDGKLDVVIGEVANAYVLKGHGDGSFDSTGTVLPIPAISGQVSLGTQSVAAGDFDGDGNQDVAVLYQLGSPTTPTNPYVDPDGSIVFIYYGKGDGTFTVPVIGAGLNHLYTAISSVDLNGDGLADLLLTNPFNLYDSPAVSIFHAKAGRAFSPEVSYTVGGGIEQSAFLDVNRDGRPDLLFANNAVSGSTANAVTVLLNRSDTHVVTGTLTASQEPSLGGLSFTLTATLVPPSPGTLAGIVSFYIDGVPAGTPTLSANAASVTVPGTLSIGTHTITAIWEGDNTYPPVSLSGFHTVGPVTSSVTLASSLNPANIGQTVTFTASVTTPVPGSGVPTGIITFLDGTNVLATQTLATSGSSTTSASFSTSTLAVGSHTITANYLSTGPFTLGSATLTQVIGGTVAATTTTALTSSSNPANVGQPVAFAVTVTNTTSSGGAPTGSVTFMDGTTLLATQPITSSSNTASTATFSTSTLTVGSHAITATYNPTGAFAGSSAAITETVQPLPPQDFTITLASPSLTIQTQHHLTTSLTLTSINGLTDSLAIACTNLPAYITCHPTPSPTTLAANGTATISLYLDTDSTLGYAHNTTGPTHATKTPINMALLLSPFGLLAAMTAFPRRRHARRTRLRLFVLLLAAIPLTVALTGCGNDIFPFAIPPSTPPGTYTIPITATAAASGISHTANLTLTVTP